MRRSKPKPARGIPFSPPMMGANLEGLKTQTRRMRWQRGGRENWLASVKPGELLHVREAIVWGARRPRYDAGAPIKAPGWLEPAFVDLALRPADDSERSGFQPSRNMPRWATRCTLRVTDVRLERVDVISEADARAEGVITRGAPGKAGPLYAHWGAWTDLCGGQWSVAPAMMSLDPVSAFACLWDSLNGEPGRRFEDRPEVVALTYEWIDAPFWDVLGIPAERALGRV